MSQFLRDMSAIADEGPIEFVQNALQTLVVYAETAAVQSYIQIRHILLQQSLPKDCRIHESNVQMDAFLGAYHAVWCSSKESTTTDKNEDINDDFIEDCVYYIRDTIGDIASERSQIFTRELKKRSISLSSLPSACANCHLPLHWSIAQSLSFLRQHTHTAFPTNLGNTGVIHQMPISSWSPWLPLAMLLSHDTGVSTQVIQRTCADSSPSLVLGSEPCPIAAAHMRTVVQRLLRLRSSIHTLPAMLASSPAQPGIPIEPIVSVETVAAATSPHSSTAMDHTASTPASTLAATPTSSTLVHDASNPTESNMVSATAALYAAAKTATTTSTLHTQALVVAIPSPAALAAASPFESLAAGVAIGDATGIGVGDGVGVVDAGADIGDTSTSVDDADVAMFRNGCVDCNAVASTCDVCALLSALYSPSPLKATHIDAPLTSRPAADVDHATMSTGSDIGRFITDTALAGRLYSLVAQLGDTCPTHCPVCGAGKHGAAATVNIVINGEEADRATASKGAAGTIVGTGVDSDALHGVCALRSDYPSLVTQYTDAVYHIRRWRAREKGHEPGEHQEKRLTVNASEQGEAVEEKVLAESVSLFRKCMRAFNRAYGTLTTPITPPPSSSSSSLPRPLCIRPVLAPLLALALLALHCAKHIHAHRHAVPQALATQHRHTSHDVPSRPSFLPPPSVSSLHRRVARSLCLLAASCAATLAGLVVDGSHILEAGPGKTHTSEKNPENGHLHVSGVCTQVGVWLCAIASMGRTAQCLYELSYSTDDSVSHGARGGLLVVGAAGGRDVHVCDMSADADEAEDEEEDEDENEYEEEEENTEEDDKDGECGCAEGETSSVCDATHTWHHRRRRLWLCAVQDSCICGECAENTYSYDFDVDDSNSVMTTAVRKDYLHMPSSQAWNDMMYRGCDLLEDADDNVMDTLDSDDSLYIQNSLDRKHTSYNETRLSEAGCCCHAFPSLSAHLSQSASASSAASSTPLPPPPASSPSQSSTVSAPASTHLSCAESQLHRFTVSRGFILSLLSAVSSSTLCSAPSASQAASALAHLPPLLPLHVRDVTLPSLLLSTDRVGHWHAQSHGRAHSSAPYPTTSTSTSITGSTPTSASTCAHVTNPPALRPLLSTADCTRALTVPQTAPRALLRRWRHATAAKGIKTYLFGSSAAYYARPRIIGTPSTFPETETVASTVAKVDAVAAAGKGTKERAAGDVKMEEWVAVPRDLDVVFILPVSSSSSSSPSSSSSSSAPTPAPSPLLCGTLLTRMHAHFTQHPFTPAPWCAGRPVLSASTHTHTHASATLHAQARVQTSPHRQAEPHAKACMQADMSEPALRVAAPIDAFFLSALVARDLHRLRERYIATQRRADRQQLDAMQRLDAVAQPIAPGQQGVDARSPDSAQLQCHGVQSYDQQHESATSSPRHSPQRTAGPGTHDACGSARTYLPDWRCQCQSVAPEQCLCLWGPLCHTWWAAHTPEAVAIATAVLRRPWALTEDASPVSMGLAWSGAAEVGTWTHVHCGLVLLGTRAAELLLRMNRSCFDGSCDENIPRCITDARDSHDVRLWVSSWQKMVSKIKDAAQHTPANVLPCGPQCICRCVCAVCTLASCVLENECHITVHPQELFIPTSYHGDTYMALRDLVRALVPLGVGLGKSKANPKVSDVLLVVLLTGVLFSFATLSQRLVHKNY